MVGVILACPWLAQERVRGGRWSHMRSLTLSSGLAGSSRGCAMARLQIALVRRDRHGPGQFSLPKGKVQSSDSSVLAAALREVQEETGILAAPGDIAGVHQYPVGSGSKVVLFWWMECLSEGPVTDTGEVTGIAWYEPHAAADGADSSGRTRLPGRRPVAWPPRGAGDAGSPGQGEIVACLGATVWRWTSAGAPA